MWCQCTITSLLQSTVTQDRLGVQVHTRLLLLLLLLRLLVKQRGCAAHPSPPTALQLAPTAWRCCCGATRAASRRPMLHTAHTAEPAAVRPLDKQSRGIHCIVQYSYATSSSCKQQQTSCCACNALYVCVACGLTPWRVEQCVGVGVVCCSMFHVQFSAGTTGTG